MGRRAAKVTMDEVRRMVKAVQGIGLSVSSVDFDGERLSVKIASNGEKVEAGVDRMRSGQPVKEVPTL